MSCAHWLGWACGIDAHTAREKVRVARALEKLPLLSEALSKGELGYSKARALTRVATADNEAYLLDIGRHGTAAHVEKFARLYRQASRANETERADARHRERGLTFWHEGDGTVVLHGRFPPEMAARIVSALEAAMAAHAAEQPAADWGQEYSAPPDVPRGTPAPKPPVTVRRADALAWMADRVFEEGDARPSRRTGTRSWCTWTPRCSQGAGRGGAKSSLTRPLRGRRRGVFAAMRASSPRSMAPPASRSPSDGAPAPFPPRCAERSSSATADAASPGAPPPTGCTDITCGTGPRAARPRSTTCSCSARSTTDWCTRGASTCIGSMTGRTASSLPRVDGPATEVARPLVTGGHRQPQRGARARHGRQDRDRALGRPTGRLRPGGHGGHGFVGARQQPRRVRRCGRRRDRAVVSLSAPDHAPGPSPREPSAVRRRPPVVNRLREPHHRLAACYRRMEHTALAV